MKYSDLNAQGRCNVQLVKALAEKRYDQSYGYQVIVECYTEDELAETFGGFKTGTEAVSLMEDLVSIRNEQYAAARADAF
jgi:hypothetical protein